MRLVMKCGHAANGVEYHADGTTKPICIRCPTIRSTGWDVVVDRIDLYDRKSRCTVCDAEVPSHTVPNDLFYQPTQPHDTHRCKEHE